MAKNLEWFCFLYLKHYFDLESADFHPELIELLTDWSKRSLAIAGFRGCAKSTFAGLVLPLWAALEGKSKFIIPVNETDGVVRLTIANIRQELEYNGLILKDYGEMISDKNKNTKSTETNILLANGCRIFGRSRGQKIRGLRHLQYRPDLVIIDDPEERERIGKKDYRDKTEAWLRGDVIPSIEESKARLIIIGNILHTDSLMARLKKDPLFVHKEYPLLADGKCAWRGKYPTQEALDKQQHKVGRTAWMREYLLKVVPPEGQEVREEDIKYYDRLPEGLRRTAVGVDLAISKKDTADFTAMAGGVAAYIEGLPKIYILPSPVNAHLTFHETLQQMKSLMTALKIYSLPEFFVEDVAYQKAAIQEGQRNMIPITAIRPGLDKRARLRTAATFIQNGTVLFPRKGCEDLIAQLVGFGVEDHDDLADAFVYLVLGLAQRGIRLPEFKVLG